MRLRNQHPISISPIFFSCCEPQHFHLTLHLTTMVLIKFRLPFRDSRKSQAAKCYAEPESPSKLLQKREVDSVPPQTHLSISINNPRDSTMLSTPPITGTAPPLSLLVLLPTTAHMRQHPTPLAPASRPVPLTSRKSGSTLPSMRQLSAARWSDEQETTATPEETEIDKVIIAGRRLSLAPGIGAGTQQTRFTSGLAPLTDIPSTPNMTGSSREAPPAFGARPPTEQSTPPSAFGTMRGSGSRGPPSKRRPQTAATSAIPLAQGLNGSGMGFGGGVGAGRNRPGWEGDEVVGVLRNSGLEG